jgi:hypothetical protein
MIEIMYGDHYKQAELAGKSVAEARGQYQDEFGIPDKAQAKLNSKPVKKKLEAETKLGYGDELSFEVKKASKIPFLAGALLLALTITGGVFAYGFMTGMAIFPMVGVGDPNVANVTVVSPFPTMDRVFGDDWSDIASGDLFRITPAVNYTGDLTARVYLANTDELARVFRHFNLRLRGPSANATAMTTREELLTLDNGAVAFDFWVATTGVTFNITLVDGSFRTHSRHPRDWSPGWEAAPVLFVEVTPR